MDRGSGEYAERRRHVLLIFRPEFQRIFRAFVAYFRVIMVKYCAVAVCRNGSKRRQSHFIIIISFEPQGAYEEDSFFREGASTNI